MKRFLFALLLFISSAAHADFYWTFSGGGGVQYSSAVSACQAMTTYWATVQNAGAFPGVYSRIGAGTTLRNCIARKTVSDPEQGIGDVIRGGASCDAGKTYDQATGACLAGQIEPDPNCPPGMRVWAWGTIEHTGEPIPMCAPDGDPFTTIPEIPEKQCSYMNPTTGFCEAACRNGSYYGQVPTGAYACIQESTGETDKTDEPTECPRGYVNLSATAGEPNCTPVDPNSPGLPTAPPGSKGETTPPTPSTSQTTSKPTTTTTNPDGSTTGVTETSVKNRDGSTTTTTTTKHTGLDGKVTESSTSTTSTTPDGKPGKSDSQTNDQTDLCIRHPELSICQVSSVTKASCSTGTVCTGDAISCAILRQQIVESCDQAAADKAIKESAAHNLGTAAMAGNDPAAGTLPTKDNASEVALPGMDQSGWIGGGACFTDTTFMVQGYTITIPWSEVCDYLIVFRYISMIIALLVSFRILSGAIIRE